MVDPATDTSQLSSLFPILPQTRTPPILSLSSACSVMLPRVLDLCSSFMKRRLFIFLVKRLCGLRQTQSCFRPVGTCFHDFKLAPYPNSRLKRRRNIFANLGDPMYWLFFSTLVRICHGATKLSGGVGRESAQCSDSDLTVILSP
jgi:hypothetical protein